MRALNFMLKEQLMTNVIDSREDFLARRRKKPGHVLEHQVVRRDLIKVKPFPAAKCPQKEIRPFLKLSSDIEIAGSIIIDEHVVLIAGEKHYRATRAAKVPVFLIAGLSQAQKVALRKAYALRGGRHD
jgi:hypothetical protein